MRADGPLASHSPFPERYCFHPALSKFLTQRRRSSSSLRPSSRRKSLTFHRKTAKFLKYCNVRVWLHVLPAKKFQKFFLPNHACVDSKSSRCYSPVEALQVGESSWALRRPLPEISEITNTQTNRQSHTQTDRHGIRLLI